MRDEPLSPWATIPPDRSPTVTKGSDCSTYVPAPRPRQTVTAPVIDAPVIDTAAAWESQPTVQEVGTPVHRAIATLIRAAPIVLLLVILGAPVAWFVVGAWDWIWAATIMTGFGLIGILAVTLWDLQWNSPSSTERHRIDRAYSLKRQELKQTHELRRAIVDAYIEHLNSEEEK